MFQFIISLAGRAAAIVMALYMASSFIACSFTPPEISGGHEVDLSNGIQPYEVNAILQSGPITRELDESTTLKFETSDELLVRHSRICVKAKRAYSDGSNGGEYGIRLQTRVPMTTLPYDTATAFLNGWSLEYTQSDHQVLALGVGVFNITWENKVLTFEAGGLIMDQNGDDSLKLCVYPTVVAWNSNLIEALTWHEEFEDELTFTHQTGHDGETTALRNLSGSYQGDAQDSLFIPKAVIPRGFAFLWEGSEDHNLLQLAFDLGYHLYLQHRPGAIAWNSRTILKDNRTRANYYGAELVSVLSGPGITEIPQGASFTRPFPMQPRNKGNCPGDFSFEVTEQSWFSQIEGYDYIVPVLKGFDIAGYCDDNHVTKIGAGINAFNFDPSRNLSTYTIESSFFDKDNNPGADQSFFNVSLLGFKVKQP